jgi:FkbM family methyltransferase
MKVVRVIKWLIRQIYFIGFRIRHPKVPIIRPLSLGTYYSQEGQDLYLTSLLFNELNNSQDCYIIDIGCNHPERFSNSYFFEKFFKCKVIAIDPIEEYGELWRNLRPNAIFIATALGRTEDLVTLNVPLSGSIYDDMFSSLTKNPKVGCTGCAQRKVPCVTLTSVLNTYKIKEVTLISIDVEGAELNILEGIDFDRVLIKCFVIENNTFNLFGSEQIRLFMKLKGYIFFSRIGFYDDVFIHNSLVKKIGSA